MIKTDGDILEEIVNEIVQNSTQSKLTTWQRDELNFLKRDVIESLDFEFLSGVITYLPESFGDLKNLKKLTIYRTKIKNLPESFGELINLEELNLVGNELVTLPESVGNLKKLKKLYLHKNELEYLPESFGDLMNLEYLDIGCNFRMTSLPESFGNLSNLKDLGSHLPDFFSLPPSILNFDNTVAGWYSIEKVEELVKYWNISSKFLKDTMTKSDLTVSFDSKYIFVFEGDLDSSSRSFLRYSSNLESIDNRLNSGPGSVSRLNLRDMNRELGFLLVPNNSKGFVYTASEGYLEEGLHAMDRLDILKEWVKSQGYSPSNRKLRVTESNIISFKYMYKDSQNETEIVLDEDLSLSNLVDNLEEKQNIDIVDIKQDYNNWLSSNRILSIKHIGRSVRTNATLEDIAGVIREISPTEDSLNFLVRYFTDLTKNFGEHKHGAKYHGMIDIEGAMEHHNYLSKQNGLTIYNTFQIAVQVLQKQEQSYLKKVLTKISTLLLGTII